MPTIRCPECEEKVKVSTDDERATVRCESCGHKIRLDDKDDGAFSSKPTSKKRSSEEGISEGPPRRSSRKDDDDDDDEPIRPKKKKTNKTAKRLLKSGKWLLDTMSLPVKIIVGLAIVAMLVSCLHPYCYLVPLLYGLILIVLGGLLFMVVVFNDSPVEIMMCIFLPFYSLYYLISHWEETKETLYLQLFGIFVCFSLICPMSFHAVMIGAWGAVAGKGPGPAPLAANKGPDNRPPPFPIVNPPDNRPIENRPIENKPIENKPIENKPIENKPIENKPIEKQPAPRITGDVALDQLLDDFNSKDSNTRAAAVKTFKDMKPNEHRAAVSKRLLEVAKTGDVSTRHTVLDLMKTLATKEDTPALIGFLNDQDVHARNLTLQALGEVRDERAVPAMLQTLVSLPTQWHSEQALRKLGPAAEPGLLNAVNDKDIRVKNAAVRELGQVGTVRSVPTLQALIQQDITVRVAAQQALGAIVARANKK